MLTIGFLGDTFEEIKDPLHLQEQGCKYLYGWVPHRWQKHHFEKAVWRMLKTGDIEKVIIKGHPVIKLTSNGQDRFIREFPLFPLSQKPWDRRWRIVSFDIPEKLKGRRQSLCHKIEGFGMGQLQESLYITPYDFGKDLQEFIVSHGLSDFVLVFEARHTFGEDAKDLAWRVWHLDELAEEYEVLWEILDKKQMISPLDRSQVQVKFEEIILADPLLPKELLPKGWIGFKVRKKILGY